MAVKNITPTGYEVLIEKTASYPEVRITGERGQAFCTLIVKPLDSMDQPRVFSMNIRDLEQAVSTVLSITTLRRT